MASVEVTVTRSPIALRGVGAILISSFLFAVMAVCVRLAAREMPALQIACLRFMGSLLLLLVFTRGQGLSPRAGSLRTLLLRGLLGAGAISLYYLGNQGAGAGLATLLHCTYPVFTVLFAATLMGERFSSSVAVALGLNLLGVIIVVGPGAHLGSEVTLGAVSALGAAVLAGGAVATARYLRARESAALITTYFMAVGAAVTAPSLLVGLPSPSLSLILALVGVIVPSAAGQFLLHHGLGFTSATQGSLAAATTVVSTAALEAVSIGEHLSGHTLLGACMMILAVGVASRR
jgi:drug/metabolite transporter (DMT)-like permease